jgi:hypothetical protein
MQLCFEKGANKVTKHNLQEAVISNLRLKMAQKPMQKINMKLGTQPNAIIMIKNIFLNAKMENTTASYDFFRNLKAVFMYFYDFNAFNAKNEKKHRVSLCFCDKMKITAS